MAEFSVSYSGLEEAYSNLYTTYSRFADISSDLYQLSNLVSDAKSLANKGYYDKIVECARNAHTTGEHVLSQGNNLYHIGRQYSAAEKKALDGLSERVTPEAGFSAESLTIANNAVSGYEPIRFLSFGQALKEETLTPVHDLEFLLNEFRYFRSTTGRDFIEKYSIKCPERDKFIGIINGHINRFESIAHGMLNPTNPHALKGAAETVGDIFGYSQVIKLYNRYSNIQGAVESNAYKELEAGHTGKYLVKTLVGSTLTFGQLAVDSVATGAKVVLDDVTGGEFSKTVEPLDKVFAGWGDSLRKMADSI